MSVDPQRNPIWRLLLDAGKQRLYERWVDDAGILWPEPGEGIPGYHRVAEDAFKAGYDAVVAVMVAARNESGGP